MTATITLGGDLEVGRIGYGAMRLTGPNVWRDDPSLNSGTYAVQLSMVGQ